MTRAKSWLRLLAALACLGAAFALINSAGLPERKAYSGFYLANSVYVAPELGALAPPFTLWTTAFQALSLDQIQADAIIINFWATWCGPCRAEMRDLQALYEAEPGNWRILAVNLGESAATAQAWAAELGLTYDILLDPLGEVARLYQIRGQPSTYLLDSGRRIQQIYFGPLPIEALAAGGP